MTKKEKEEKKIEQGTALAIPKDVLEEKFLDQIRAELAPIKQIQEILQAIGFPPQAVISFFEAREMTAYIRERIAEQSRLTDKEKMELMGVRPERDFISRAEMKRIDRFVQENQVPYDQVSALKFGGLHVPYAKVDGRFDRAKADPRLYRDYEVLYERVELDAEDPWAEFRVRLHYWTGQYFDGYGCATLSDLKAKFETDKRKMTKTEVPNFARTRAKGDALKAALPRALGPLPEEIGYEKEEVGPFVKPVAEKLPEEPPFRNLSQALTATAKKFKVMPREILAQSGKAELKGIPLDRIWEIAGEIARKRGETAVGEG